MKQPQRDTKNRKKTENDYRETLNNYKETQNNHKETINVHGERKIEHLKKMQNVHVEKDAT